MPLLRRLRSPSAAVEMASAAAADATRVVFLGVDVGTGSARAGLFDKKGRLLGSASSPIQIWKEKDCIEQSSTDIWHAICAAVKAVCSLANVAAQEVVGLGFAATCSLAYYFKHVQLLWVKENLHESWSMVFRWMDFSDWLAYRMKCCFSRSSFGFWFDTCCSKGEFD